MAFAFPPYLETSNPPPSIFLTFLFWFTCTLKTFCAYLLRHTKIKMLTTTHKAPMDWEMSLYLEGEKRKTEDSIPILFALSFCFLCVLPVNSIAVVWADSWRRKKVGGRNQNLMTFFCFSLQIFPFCYLIYFSMSRSGSSPNFPVSQKKWGSGTPSDVVSYRSEKHKGIIF